MVKALLLDKQNQSQAPAHQNSVKAIEESCVTCGGAHSYQSCPATDGNVYHDNIRAYVSQAAAANFNQGNTSARPPMVANQIRPPGWELSHGNTITNRRKDMTVMNRDIEVTKDTMLPIITESPKTSNLGYSRSNLKSNFRAVVDPVSARGLNTTKHQFNFLQEEMMKGARLKKLKIN
ncbi:hypothetical protein Tco_0972195 [Tanacetum coccineum]